MSAGGQDQVLHLFMLRLVLILFVCALQLFPHLEKLKGNSYIFLKPGSCAYKLGCIVNDSDLPKFGEFVS